MSRPARIDSRHASRRRCPHRRPHRMDFPITEAPLMADVRRIHVFVLVDGQRVEPGSCPACRWRFADFGCRPEAAWDVGPDSEATDEDPGGLHGRVPGPAGPDDPRPLSRRSHAARRRSRPWLTRPARPRPTAIPTGWPPDVFAAVTDALARALVADLRANPDPRLLTTRQVDAKEMRRDGLDSLGPSPPTSPAPARLEPGRARAASGRRQEHDHAPRDRQPAAVRGSHRTTRTRAWVSLGGAA